MRWIDFKLVPAALAGAVFCLAAALGAGPGASAALAGPGVTLLSSASPNPVTFSGAQIKAAADTPPRTYTVRASAHSAGTKITLGGLSIRGLLRLAGFDPDRVEFISIIRPDGPLTTLERADFADPPPFPEGPALVADEPGGTRYLRPVRRPANTNASDSFVVSSALDVTVAGGALLAVRASASPRRTASGHAVSLSASVRFPPPGATFSYGWDFGDGTQGSGAHVTHRYTQEGDLQARVVVWGGGGSTAACPVTCGGIATVNVRVGTPHTSPRPHTTSGAGGTSSHAAGSGGSGAGSGSGSGSGSGNGSGTGSGRAAPGHARHQRSARAPSGFAGTTITGILLADSGTATASSLPALRPAGGRARHAADAGSSGGGTLGGSVALTLMLVGLGALYERRRGQARRAA